jgi:hydrogenase nickel incorporation protein HypB
MDLAPHLEIDLNRLIDHVRQVNPAVTVLTVSAKTGEGLPAWYAWVQSQISEKTSQLETQAT